jgi:hypothetical protein
MLCDTKSPAGRRYQRTVLWEMGCYMVILWGVDWYVRRHHPAGAELYALAALPSIPIFGVLFAVAIYLRDEKDEFQRDLMVKSLLWGTAGVLALSTFFGFLHSFGWTGNVPPFLEFMTFWLLVAGSSATYKWMNRPGPEEALHEGGE